MTCDTLGLYARSVADLQLLSSIFQLADDEPIPTTPFQIKGSKIAFVKTHVWPKAGPGTKDAWEKAKRLLEKNGASVEEIDLPSEFSKITNWHHAVLSGEGRTSFLGRMFLHPTFLTCIVLMRLRLSPRQRQNALFAAGSCQQCIGIEQEEAAGSI
jgi:Asp-tRNA(Asn)/Glu-tRNA(Gln) amidotransferase A subunit family amidase